MMLVCIIACNSKKSNFSSDESPSENKPTVVSESDNLTSSIDFYDWDEEEEEELEEEIFGVEEPIPEGYTSEEWEIEQHLIAEDHALDDSYYNQIFESSEQMPQFPGGDESLIKYISEHIVYPQSAKDKGIEGRVIVRFVVQKNGSIDNVRVIRPIDPDLDKEAVRVVSALPKFIPGKMNGYNVAVYFTVPVRFNL